MNKYKRANINDIKDKIDEARQQIQEVIDEEQESYDNLPESLQDTVHGQSMDEAISNLQKAADALDSIDKYLDAAAT